MLGNTQTTQMLDISAIAGSRWRDSEEPSDSIEQTVAEPKVDDPLLFCDNFTPTRDGDLVKIDAAKFRAHVRDCVECRSEMIHEMEVIL